MTPSRIAVLFAATALLAACGKEAAAPAPAPATAAAPAAQQQAQQAVSIETIQAETQGFTAGQAMSARTVYVFFDAQCPHCGALWYAAKPLKSQAKFVWIPVRLLKDESETQGAAILAAKDPAAAMDNHEASMQDRKGGIKAEGDIAAQRAAIKKNTALFNKYAFGAVPALVTKSAKTGAVVTHEGSLQTADLAAFIGVPAPTQ
ncbi:thioredoxin fold domain-containing protein [Ramlibacter sp. PS4R-6]|uniref:thioredoxin fold domain-containing protein n=1 Tax=Ramlibacter sp. PS4R-6 TaxID=3133438 RepID=UPI0030A44E6D